MEESPKKGSFSFFALISLLSLEIGIYYIPSFPVWELFTHSKIHAGLWVSLRASHHVLLIRTLIPTLGSSTTHNKCSVNVKKYCWKYVGSRYSWRFTPCVQHYISLKGSKLFVWERLPIGNSSAWILLVTGKSWQGLPGRLSGKESTSNAGDTRGEGSISGSGRSSGGGNDNTLPYSCLENPMDRGARQTTVHGVRKDLVTK